MLYHDRLVMCVRAVADGAHAVERGNAERGGEVAVGGAAGGSFFQGEAKFRGHRPGLAIEPHGSATTLHGRTVDAAGDGKCAGFVHRLQAGKPTLDPWA